MSQHHVRFVQGIAQAVAPPGIAEALRGTVETVALPLVAPGAQLGTTLLTAGGDACNQLVGQESRRREQP